MSLRLAVAAVAGYGLGQIPSTRLAARLAGAAEDVVAREGTSNPGGLNTAHVLGRRWGAAVSAADVAKGVLAAVVGRRLAGEHGANAAASAAVAGHCYPLRRRGGKGVATSVGQVIGTFPAYLPVDVVVATGVAAVPGLARRTEMATTVASIAWVGCSLAWWRRGWASGAGSSCSVAVPVGAAISSLVIASRFRAERDRVDDFNTTATGATR